METMKTAAQMSNDDHSDGDAEENDDENSAAPGRCKAKCKKSGSRCLKNCGHAGRHKFTQQGRLSPSATSKIAGQLTDGKIKSLAGLDDIDSEMGGENFENMRSVVNTLDEVARLNDVDDTFHKLGFSEHLGQGETLAQQLFMIHKNCIH